MFLLGVINIKFEVGAENKLAKYLNQIANLFYFINYLFFLGKWGLGKLKGHPKRRPEGKESTSK